MQYDKIHYWNLLMGDCILRTYIPGTQLLPDYLHGLCLPTRTQTPQGGFYNLITGPFDNNTKAIGSWAVTESKYPLDNGSLGSLAEILYMLTGTLFTSDYPIILPIGLQNMTLLKAEASSFNKPGCLVLGDVIPRLETNLSRALLIGYAALIVTEHITDQVKPQIWISQCMDLWRASIQVPKQKAITIYPPPGKV